MSINRLVAAPHCTPPPNRNTSKVSHYTATVVNLSDEIAMAVSGIHTPFLCQVLFHIEARNLAIKHREIPGRMRVQCDPSSRPQFVHTILSGSANSTTTLWDPRNFSTLEFCCSHTDSLWSTQTEVPPTLPAQILQEGTHWRKVVSHNR